MTAMRRGASTRSKTRLTRERRGVGQPGDGRDGGTGTGCNDATGETQPFRAHDDALRVREPRVPEEHVHAKTPEPVRRVVGRDGGAGPADACHRLAEGQVSACAADKCLGRDTPGIQAVAAKQMPLDERDAGAQAHGARCRHESGRAAANHHEVVTVRRDGIDPVRRADLRYQLLIGGVRHRVKSD